MAVLVAAAMALVAPVGTTVASAQAPQVIISEFVAVNDTGIADADGDRADWIELHNVSSESVDLAGWSLADGNSVWIFPSVTLNANQYLVVWASGKNRLSGPALHTNFKLTSAGEYLALRAPDASVASEFSPTYPEQYSDVSYGRSDTGTLGYLLSATPGAANSGLGTPATSPPSAQVANSYQDSAFTEQLESTTIGATFRYTLDGSTPTLSSPTATGGAVPISPTRPITTLRAIAVAPGHSPSEPVTFTYVSPAATAQQYGGGSAQVSAAVRHLPVMSLRTASGGDPASADVYQQGWVDFVDPNGPGFHAPTGIKLFGNWSLQHGHKRNFRLKFSSQFGQSNLDYGLFDGFAGPEYTPATTFDQLELRGASLDEHYLISNEFTRQTILDLGTPSNHGRWANVFVNGNFRGVYRLRERINADWLKEYFGGPGSDYESVFRDYARRRISINSGTGDLIAAFDRATSWSEARDIVDGRAYVNAALSTWPYSGYTEQEWRFVGPQDPADPNGAVMIPNDMDQAFGNRHTPGRSTGMRLKLDFFAQDPEFLNLVRDQTALAFCGDGPLTYSGLTARLDRFQSQLRPALFGEQARFPSAFRVSTWDSNMTRVRSLLSTSRQTAQNEWADVGYFDGCNRSPQFGLAANLVDPAGIAVSVPIPVTDEGAFTIAATDLPSGLWLDASTKTVRGIPTTPGSYRPTFTATDSAGRLSTASLDWTITAHADQQALVMLNEYNAVDPGIGWSGSDATFGAQPDNGGDWFEVVISGGPLDLRGWSFELWDRDRASGELRNVDTITLADHEALRSVTPGTIITVAEQVPDDVEVDYLVNDWSLNIQSSTSSVGSLVTPETRANFDTNAEGFRLVVKNRSGTQQGPSMGETEATDSIAVGADAAWARCSSPGHQPQIYLANTDQSTFGMANRCGADSQDLADLRPSPGDVTCSDGADSADIIAMLGYQVGSIAPVDLCHLVVPEESIVAGLGDLDANSALELRDALLLARCLATGITDSRLCFP